jgi:type IV fimbrial biogenesis protein FimT
MQVKTMRSSQQGLTLIELMVTITVLAILVGTGVPAFASFINNSRMTSFVNATVATARLARAEAVRRNGAVTFCPSADMEVCSIPEIAQAYIVFVDRGTPNARDVATDELLLVQSFPSNSVDVSITGDAAIRYRQSGQSDGAYMLVFCDSRGAEHARTLLMVPTGRVQNLGHNGTEACS